MNNPFRRKRTVQQVGADAARLVADETYLASFEAVESIIKNALLAAPLESEADKERIIKLVLRWQSIAGSKKWLDNQIQYGRLAENRENEQELQQSTRFNRGGL